MNPATPGREPMGDGGETARVRCLYCGAINFPNAPTCRQCQRPLRPARSGPSALPQTSVAPQPLGTGLRARQQAFSSPVNPALAGQAAAALGLMFPYIGLPAGMIFLMLEDPPKVSLGWKLIGWSIAGTVINFIVLLATIGPVLAVLKGLMPSGGHGAGGGIPGLPEISGGADGTILQHFLLKL